jgi:hypothetical protein
MQISLRIIRRYRILRTEGKRTVSREIEFYNLDAIIAVGYRVRSARGTQFRKWATARLSEYLVKGLRCIREGRQAAQEACSNAPKAATREVVMARGERSSLLAPGQERPTFFSPFLPRPLSPRRERGVVDVKSVQTVRSSK